jgi:hypothetical protein
MDQEIENLKNLKNLPYFDFLEAIENYGFDFAIFSADGFSKFIKETYMNNFIELRKAFILRDFLKIRFYAHKFKGSFLYKDFNLD